MPAELSGRADARRLWPLSHGSPPLPRAWDARALGSELPTWCQATVTATSTWGGMSVRAAAAGGGAWSVHLGSRGTQTPAAAQAVPSRTEILRARGGGAARWTGRSARVRRRGVGAHGEEAVAPCVRTVVAAPGRPGLGRALARRLHASQVQATRRRWSPHCSRLTQEAQAPPRPGRGADSAQQGWLACAGPQGLSWVLGQGTAGSAPGVQGTLAPTRCGHGLVLPGAPPLTPVSLTPVLAAGPRPLGHHLDWGPPRGPALPQAHGWCARSCTFSATVMGTHLRGAEGPSCTAVVWG